MPEQQKRARQETYPGGYYSVTVKDHAFLASKTDASSVYLALTVSVIELKRALSTGPKPTIIPGSLRTINVFFTDKTKDRSVKFIKDAGFAAKGGVDMRQLDRERAKEIGKPFVSLAGYTFEAECKIETYNGKRRDKFSLAMDQLKTDWSKFNMASGAATASLAALFGSALTEDAASKTTQPAAPVAQSSPSGERVAPENEEEPPFDVPVDRESGEWD